jgi:membrane-bound ClpP family serine protease
MDNTLTVLIIQSGFIFLIILLSIFLGLLIWIIIEIKRAIRKGNLRRIQLSSGSTIDLQSERMFTVTDDIIGETGQAVTDLNPQGVVYVKNEYWRATSLSPEIIEKNSKIIVIQMNGSDLTVASMGTQ